MEPHPQNRNQTGLCRRKTGRHVSCESVFPFLYAVLVTSNLTFPLMLLEGRILWDDTGGWAAVVRKGTWNESQMGHGPNCSSAFSFLLKPAGA